MRWEIRRCLQAECFATYKWNNSSLHKLLYLDFKVKFKLLVPIFCICRLICQQMSVFPLFATRCPFKTTTCWIIVQQNLSPDMKMEICNLFPHNTAILGSLKQMSFSWCFFKRSFRDVSQKARCFNLLFKTAIILYEVLNFMSPWDTKLHFQMITEYQAIDLIFLLHTCLICACFLSDFF